MRSLFDFEPDPPAVHRGDPEVEVFGAKMCRIDIPYAPGEGGEGFAATQIVGGSAIYRLTLTTEEVARRTAAFYGRPQAVSRPALEQPPPPPPDGDDYGGDDGGDYHDGGEEDSSL